MNKSRIEKAVSLTNTQLRRSNQALRKNLRRIVELSAENEKAQERMDQLESLIYDAQSMKEMFDSLIIQGRRIFEIQFITVALDDGLRPFFPEEYKSEGKSVYLESKNVIFASGQAIASHFPSEPTLRLQGNMKKGNEFFFPEGMSSRIRSEALSPLQGPKNGLMGAVCFGSPAPDRFLEGYGSRFLDRLCRLVSLKMEAFKAAQRQAAELAR